MLNFFPLAWAMRIVFFYFGFSHLLIFFSRSPSTCLCFMPHILVFIVVVTVTNCHNFRGLKQHEFIILTVLEVRSLK